MEQFVIGIPLPSNVQKMLARLCWGLSNAEWYDSSFFHIHLQSLGNLDRATLIDLSLALKEMDFPTFFLTLQGLDRFSLCYGKKELGVSLFPSVDIQRIKKLIHHMLQELDLEVEKNSFIPCIPLGQLFPGNENKVDQFLWENHQWSYSPLLASSLALFSVHSTQKKMFYSIIEEFPLKKKPFMSSSSTS